MLPNEIWLTIMAQSRSWLVFYSTCQSFRQLLKNNFAQIKNKQDVLDAHCYQELAYFLSLNKPEQAKYCVIHDWQQTFINTSSEKSEKDLFVTWYAEKIKHAAYHGFLSFDFQEKAHFFLSMTSDRYYALDPLLPDGDFSKLPLCLQKILFEENVAERELLFQDAEYKKQVSIYWAFTGDDLGYSVCHQKWQEERELILSHGERGSFDPEGAFGEALYYHGSKELLLKHGEFGCDCREELHTEIVFARKLFTQDEFFSYLEHSEEDDWPAYFLGKGMQQSYLRALQLHK